MGLFDNIKKKNEAKNLGITVEQYDGFVSAKAQGITIDEYKRYLNAFSGKYSLEQFSILLKLEKQGLNVQECERYLGSLAAKIKAEDYSDFLEAEKLGLTVEQYVAYASSLKAKMSAVDYVGFLKAQKIGITLGKYLQYLKLFKGEMSIEEYDTYLKAEDNGMDREHYIEYLEKYKDTYTVERYLEFDKARSLGMTLEEFDLRIEASKSGMSVEKYQAHKEAEKLQMTDEEYEIYQHAGISGAIADGVLSIPEALNKLPKNVLKHFEFKSIVFPEALTEIDAGAFEDCKQLESVIIPAHIKKLGDEAFKGCEALENVIIESGVEEIGDSAFENCKKLKELFIPGTVKNFDNHAVFGCDALEKLEFEFGVESIDVSEWADLASLKTVITPSTASIKHLPPYRKTDARYGAINQNYSFSMNGDSKVDYITPAKYNEYGLEEHKDEIEYLEVHGDYVFLDLSGFSKLKVVDFLAKGSIRSASNCPDLQMVIYSNYMSSVPSGYVSSDREREEKIIEVKTLTMSNFNVPSLRFLAVDDGAMVIDLDHYSASDLAWVHIPACTSKLGLNTPSVSAVAVHGNCKIFSDTLTGAENINIVRFDKDGREDGIYSNASARSILATEFASVDQIELRIERTEFTAETMGVQGSVRHISLPEGLISIGNNGFESWGLEDITLPSSLEKLGNNAFMDCKQLKTVAFLGIPETFGCDIFDGCSSLKSITIGGRILSVNEFVNQYETHVSAPIINTEPVTAFEDILEKQKETEFVNVIPEVSEVAIKDNDDRIPVTVAGQFSLRLPADFTYSTDALVIGDNRVLIAMLDDGTANFNSPYSATESITVLVGKEVSSSDDADSVAASIGLENGNVLQDISGLNVRYAVKESGESLSIYLALICTDSNSYPAQIFFNNAIGVDTEKMVSELLESVRLESEPGSETRKEIAETPERVDLAEEKVAAIITVLKSRYPQGSILPESFEELKFKNSDLQLSTLNKWTMIAYGQKAKDYLIDEGLLPANITVADVKSQITVTTPVVERTVSTEIPAGVLYQPGSEPEKIRVRLERLFEKLDSAYPDKVIVGLNKNHKKWGETVTELYRKLGYPDNNSFLNAYGYITGTGKSGRPVNDPMEVVNELKRRYADGATCTKMADLAAENPDLASKFSNLQNQAYKFFGMTLQKYFIQEGILTGKSDKQSADEFEALKSRYADAPYAGKLNDLKSENPDIDWKAINRYYSQSGSADTFKVFLIKRGIIAEQDASFETKLAEVTEKLKKRYPEDKKFSGTLSKLKSDNSDLPLSGINTWTMQVYNLSAQDYLTQQGIMEEQESVEDKLAAVSETLKKRYASGEKKAYTITDLRKQNLDLPINSIGTWSKKVFDKSATEYLNELGVLSEYDWMESSRVQNGRKETEREREERLAAEMTAPIEPIYYEPKTYYVEEIKISGAEAKDWKTVEYWSSNPGEIFIEDYLGSKSHVIIPIEINGKKVAGLTSFAFQQCKAKTVEIPGYYKTISYGFASRNNNITTAIIGEGVTTIENSVFFNSPNLEQVMISKSVNMVVGNFAFKSTKWYDKQGDYVIAGTVLMNFKGNGAVVNVPYGITTIAELVADSRDVRKVIIPETVTVLCERAFSGSGNENIQEFVFTDSVKEIGFDAFGFNKWTKSFGDNPIIINNQLYQMKKTGSSVVIPEGVTKICTDVFKENSEIKSVSFPSMLKEIGREAFSKCEGLTSVQLPDGIERLGTLCFYRCKNLTKVNIPDSLIEIGRSAFDGCTGLAEIKLGESVEIIGEGAFINCNMLRRFKMNSSVKAILPEAFSKCTALGEIELPESLTEIGNNAFSGCVSLDNVVIPSGVTKINASVFSSCKSLKSIRMHNGITEVAGSAFENCTELTEMIIPAVVGQKAFCGCTSLKKITFTEGITKIDKNTFYGCTVLTEVIIPEGVETIEENAFCGCTALKAVSLPSTLREIGKSSFRGCISLKNICIPNAVTAIGDNAFEGCSNLAEVVMADSIPNFGLDVFTNTPYMKKTFGEFVVIGGLLSKYLGDEKDVVIPDNVTTIGENSFAEAHHVESIIIPDTVKTIADKIFGDVRTWGDATKPRLKKLVIGNGVTSIGEQAFCYCEALTDVSFGTAVSTIGQQAFCDCKKLKKIDLSKTAIKVIDQYVFYDCCNAKKLILPENIETIGRNAFSRISLGVVKLPKSVKRVERSAFDSVSELIVYDSIDPDAAWAYDWEHDKWNGSVNSPLACAMLGVYQGCIECQGNTGWRDYHITVLSADTEEIRYRIFCDSNERDTYRAMMFSAWGKHASFTFDDYDGYFMKTRNPLGRTEMAFCRIQYPEGLNAANRVNYEAFLERCLYIERSAKRTAEMIANDDNVERLQLLDDFHAIDEHNIAWIREQFEKKNAKKCLAYLNKRYSK